LVSFLHPCSTLSLCGSRNAARKNGQLR